MASSPAGPCTLHFCVSGQRRLPGPAFTHRPVTPRACCNRNCTRGEGLRSPRISCEKYPAEMPLRRANSFRDMPSWSSSSHTATGLSFTLDREVHFRFNVACFLPSVSVPSVARTTGASASGRVPRPLQRRAFVVGIGRRPCQSEYVAPSSFHPRPPAMRVGSSAALGAELRAMAGLSTRPSGGELQPVGQYPAVSGADGSLGVAVVATGYGAAGVSTWDQRERSLVPCSLMALMR